jgi:hypothetical protein
MRQSAEVRWFYKGPVPAAVKDWFCGSRLCKKEDAHTDHYLALVGSDAVSVKLRGGSILEIKARAQPPQPFTLASGTAVGLEETWVKWSHDDREVVRRLAASADKSAEWVAVAKTRLLRKFRFEVNGEVEEIDVDPQVPHGCLAELSQLNVRDSQWWSLGFESFGEVNRTTYLEQVARHVVKVLPEHGLALTEHDSMAYPGWLSRLLQ